MLVTETKITDDWTYVVYSRAGTGTMVAFLNHSCHGFVNYPKTTACNRCGAEVEKSILCTIALICLDI